MLGSVFPCLHARIGQTRSPRRRPRTPRSWSRKTPEPAPYADVNGFTFWEQLVVALGAWSTRALAHRK